MTDTTRTVDGPPAAKVQLDRLSFEKVFYHRRHMEAVLRGENPLPLHLELGLVNYCNHDCTFCYASRSKFQARGLRPTNVDRNRLGEILAEMAAGGLKSVTLVGSGEPILHPQFAGITRDVHALGVDVGLFTNGSRLTEENRRAIVDAMTFVRFSLTGVGEVHRRVHGVDDYDRILANVARLVADRRGTLPTFGVQYVLSDYSLPEIEQGCRNARDAGVDYFEIKPVFLSPEKPDQVRNLLDAEKAVAVMRRLKAEYETPGFTVHTKEQQARRVLADAGDRGYDRCLGCVTTTSIEADLDAYICINQKVPAFCFGNLSRQPFTQAWNGPRRASILAGLDVHRCPAGCRMDPLNRIYAALKRGAEPPADLPPARQEDHVNFL